MSGIGRKSHEESSSYLCIQKCWIVRRDEFSYDLTGAACVGIYDVVCPKSWIGYMMIDDERGLIEEIGWLIES